MRIKNIPGLLYKLIVVALLLIVFLQPDIQRPFITFIYENTVWLIMILTGAGIMFLFFRNSSLVYFSMICAAALTLYVKDISNHSMVYTELGNSYKVFSIHQYSCSPFKGNSDKLIESIKESGADIISVVNVSPVVVAQLHTELSEKYHFISELIDENEKGKLIFSKFEISSIDTLYLSGLPQFNIEYSVDGIPVNIIFSCILPLEQKESNEAYESQIRILAEKANRLQYKPMLIIGDFNQVYWSREMRNFIYLTELNNARRFVNAVSNRNPHSHVFYSNHINCLSFGDVYDSSSKVIGIRGRFEILKPEVALYTVGFFGNNTD